jgi:alkanesulfonate monooxygenase SsuD/methylene tetrahydromethanopterin reductase-like flavin-dependent oxidoreductase (luciferase family)
LTIGFNDFAAGRLASVTGWRAPRKGAGHAGNQGTAPRGGAGRGRLAPGRLALARRGPGELFSAGYWADLAREAEAGSPATVAKHLRVLQDAPGADELLVTTITYEHADRVRSFELLAREWGQA